MSLTRRNLMGSGAAVGLSLPVLAACGSDGGSGGTGGDGAATEETPSAGTTLASTADVPVGGGLIVEGEGVVITQPEEGTFKAFGSRCTHQGCRVTSVDSTINCSCHGSAFALADGSVEGGPAPSPLPEVAISVDGEDITTA